MLKSYLALFFVLFAVALQAANLDLLVKTAQHSDNPAIRVAMLKGMLKGLEGQRNVPAPEGWSALGAELMAGDHQELKTLARELGQIFGDQAAAAGALVLLRDPQAAPVARRAALKSLLAQQHPEVGDVLPALLDQPALRVDAIRAYAKVPGSKAAELLKRYPDFDTPERRAVVETLATRKDLAGALLGAMEKGSVSAKDVPAYLAPTLTTLLGDAFTRIYGNLREQSADKKQQIEKYTALLDTPAAAKGKASQGRVVYAKLCGACHLMYGEGGLIGPDLTGSNRANREYILLNIIDPNFDVPEAYRMVILTTKNQQVLSGTIGEEDDHKVVLKTVAGKEVVPVADIVKREVIPMSMMPEGQLETLTRQEFFDLITYLQTVEQVELPQP